METWMGQIDKTLLERLSRALSSDIETNLKWQVMSVKVAEEEQIEVIAILSRVQLPQINAKKPVATKENVHTIVDEQLEKYE